MKVKLREIADVTAGQSPASKYYSDCTGFPFLQGNRTFGNRYPLIDSFTSRITKAADAGDVLISVRAPVGDINIAPCDLCIGRGLAAIKAKDGDNVFLYYALKQNVRTLTKRGNGTTYDSVDSDTLLNLDLLIPEKENLCAYISSLLNALDDSIENNSSICSDLEAAAKLLYDYWFVQFDFPDENGKPYKSSGGKMVWNEELKREVPEGWTVSVLSDLCETRLGGTPDTDNQDYWDGDLPWLNSGEVAKSPILKSEKRITERGLEESPASFAPAGSVLLSITRYIRPSLLAIDACFNQSVVAILESDNLKASFIYPLITNEIPRYMMLRTGAQQPHINKETVDSTFVVVPPTALLNKYYETANRLLDLLVSTAKESEELTVTRNFLLPLLMNGQVTIGDGGK